MPHGSKKINPMKGGNIYSTDHKSEFFHLFALPTANLIALRDTKSQLRLRWVWDYSRQWSLYFANIEGLSGSVCCQLTWWFLFGAHVILCFNGIAALGNLLLWYTEERVWSAGHQKYNFSCVKSSVSRQPARSLYLGWIWYVRSLPASATFSMRTVMRHPATIPEFIRSRDCITDSV